MNSVVTIVGITLLLYIGYKSRGLQKAISAAQTAGPPMGSQIPNIQVDVADQFMDPSMVTRLINQKTRTFDIPGNYGVRQRNYVQFNNNQMATYGRNYSKSFT